MTGAHKRTIRKLTLLAFALVLAGAVLSLTIYVGNTNHGWGFFPAFPWLALGESLLSAFVVGLIYEWLTRSESQAERDDHLTKLLSVEREKLLDALLIESLSSPDRIGRFSKDQIEDLTCNVLEARLADRALASDLGRNLIGQFGGTGTASTRFDDMKMHISLNGRSKEPSTEAMMDVQITYSFQKNLARPDFRMCVAEENETLFAQLSPTRGWDHVWYPGRRQLFADDLSDAITIDYAYIDNNNLDVQVRPLVVEGRAVGTEFIARSDELESLVGKSVSVSFSYIARVARSSGVLAFPIAQPTHRLDFELVVDDPDISAFNCWPFLSTAAAPKVVKTNTSTKRRVVMHVNRWVLAGGGICISWR
ncbi:hypothetical protein [Williamsia muralis]|uniref:Uncharacterized protein n=1 Tax=Williamsia marianensis TaxID=85044 RepID=A0A2G3PN26_WILMA|nr:hypothetical protein [Williamsia marianensis]PHV67237.1 hypothetical protein CSW57_13700 [Williamsia marianensis]